MHLYEEGVRLKQNVDRPRGNHIANNFDKVSCNPLRIIIKCSKNEFLIKQMIQLL